MKSDERSAFEEEGPRDSRLMRWAKFGSILVILPILFGLGLVFEEFFRVSRRAVDVRVSFIIGASVGAIFAIAYVTRCIARDIDP